MLFRIGAYFGHFGGDIEYANEPNLHVVRETSSRDAYENLGSIQ